MTNTVQTAPEVPVVQRMSDWIEGDVGDDGHQVAIGKNLRQTNIQKDTASWREFVRRDLEALENKVMILFIAVMVLFILGAVTTGLVIRQVDLIYSRIDRIERRIPYGPPEYYYPGIPMP